MKRNLFAILFLLAVVLGLTIIQFKPVLKNPNSFLFSHGGDAVKSYYNFSYHLKYGEGIRYKGINYPYAEHPQYENTHPFHLVVLKQVNKVIPLDRYGVAIINLSMIFSFLLTIPFLFLILRRYKLPVWYAIITALIILYLSPQLDRIKGHFEMVYLFFIPMFWYLLLRFRDGVRQWLWGSLLVIAGLIGGFTSAYFVAFYAILLLSVLVADLWLKRKNLKSYIKPGLILLTMAIIPLIVVKGLVSMTDWAPDRPNNPWGFYIFHANLFSVFLPDYQAMKSLFSTWTNFGYQWEGRSYIGLPASLLAVSMIFTIVYQAIKKQKDQFLFQHPEMNTFLLGAVLVLLFSMCFPFKYGFGFLLDILPPVKQFRALGRFAWIFYYVFTVYAAILFWKSYQTLKEKAMPVSAILFLTFVLGSWSLDAAINAKKSFSGIFLPNNKLESNNEPYRQMLREANINTEDYQAIFFLPFANTSGDKLLFEEGMNAFAEAMKCAYHTGLPLIQSFSPRLPFPHALSSIQMLADSAIRKTRLDDMNDQPLLLVITNEKLTKEEQWLKDHATALHTYSNVSLASFELNVFHQSHQNWQNYADSTIKKLSGSVKIKADVPISRLYHRDFEEATHENSFAGRGALFQRRNKIEVFSENFSEKGMDGSYELSFWMYFDTRMYDMPQPKLHLYQNGKYQKTIRLNNRHIHNIYDRWVRVEQLFDIQSGFTYQLEVEGKYIALDELLLKPVSCNVLIETQDGRKLFNNFPLD
jgi:hypothetical protein